MSTIPKKFGFIRTTLALWAANVFAGRAGVVTDSMVTGNVGERWGWHDGSAWKFAATSGTDETFNAVVLSGLSANAIPRLDADKKTVASAFSDDGTVARSSRAFIAAGNVIAGDVVGGIPGSVYIVGTTSLWPSTYMLHDGNNRFITRYNPTGDVYEIVRRNDDGAQREIALTLARAAGGPMVYTGAATFSKGVGFFGALAPATRPTVNAAATDLATVITLTNQLRTHLIACGLVQ